METLRLHAPVKTDLESRKACAIGRDKGSGRRVKRRGSCSAAGGDIHSKVIAYYYGNVLCEAVESMCARLVWCRRVPGDRTVVAGPWRPLKSIREDFARLSSLLSSGMLATSSVALPQVLYYYRQ